jgi:hypothetical protein
VPLRLLFLGTLHSASLEYAHRSCGRAGLKFVLGGRWNSFCRYFDLSSARLGLRSSCRRGLAKGHREALKKRIGVAVVLAVLITASAYAQTTDFLELVRTGTPQDVQAALDKGADIEAWAASGTALMWAAHRNQNPEVITALLKAGADIEDRALSGGTALIAANSNNPNLEVIIILLNAIARYIPASPKPYRIFIGIT